MAVRTRAVAVGLQVGLCHKDLLRNMVEAATTGMRDTMIADGLNPPAVVFPWNEVAIPLPLAGPSNVPPTQLPICCHLLRQINALGQLKIF